MVDIISTTELFIYIHLNMDSLFIFAATVAENQQETGNVVLDLARQFGVNWSSFIAQVVNFTLLTFVLYRFAFKPVLKTLSERQQKIAEGLQYAEEMKQKLSEAEKGKAETLKKASLEAQKLLNDANEKAKALLDKNTQEASSKVEGILQKATEETERERKKMIKEVQVEISRLVVETTAKVLAKKLSEKDRQDFSSQATEELKALN